ncbi:unnamed protein product [Pocillopora meandrina]|uniref:Uncharacterized protein n=1 Tax=Pocillopora meandrina TaxID=46732 RepID=A0AAU9XMF5_9CNID|nr:unnamed protein product [Pocillopora meandrina]
MPNKFNKDKHELHKLECGSFAKMPQKDLLKLVFKHNRMDRFHHEMTSQEKVFSTLIIVFNSNHGYTVPKEPSNFKLRLTFEYQQQIKSLPSDPRLIAEDEWRNNMTTWPASGLGTLILSKNLTRVILLLFCRWIHGYGILTHICYCQRAHFEMQSYTIPTMKRAFSMGFPSPSCTSVPCRWNDYTFREVHPKKIMSVNVLSLKKPKIDFLQNGKKNYL